jgi:hypothetical protein
VIEARSRCFTNRIAQTESARERDGAARSFPRGPPVDEAEQVMGSRDRL